MILSKDFIINNSIKFKKDVFGGVYFLSKNNNIVYVGQTIDINKRIKAHRKNMRIVFDRYFYIKDEDLNGVDKNTIEKTYIEAFKPLYNFEHNPDYINGKKELLGIAFKNFKSIKEISNMLNVSENQVADIVKYNKRNKHFEKVSSFLLNKEWKLR